jgi:hypothetical protein
MLMANGVGSGLTTQAQRPGAREATMATATPPPGSLQRMVRHHGESSLALGRKATSSATGTAVHRKMSAPVVTSPITSLSRDSPGMSIGSPRPSEREIQNQPPLKSNPTLKPQITAFVRLERVMT